MATKFSFRLKLLLGVLVIGAGMVGLAGLGLLGLAYFWSSNARDNADPARQTEMRSLTLEWGRLAVFPANVRDFSIHTEGNAFTRRFRGSFVGDPATILKWVQGSPGITDGTQEKLPDGSIKYVLKMGGGAGYGEVVISSDGAHVSFSVEWS